MECVERASCQLPRRTTSPDGNTIRPSSPATGMWPRLRRRPLAGPTARRSWGSISAASLRRPKPPASSFVADIHARFERIYPFRDGNGSVDRLATKPPACPARIPACGHPQARSDAVPGRAQTGGPRRRGAASRDLRAGGHRRHLPLSASGPGRPAATRPAALAGRLRARATRSPSPQSAAGCAQFAGRISGTRPGSGSGSTRTAATSVREFDPRERRENRTGQLRYSSSCAIREEVSAGNGPVASPNRLPPTRVLPERGGSPTSPCSFQVAASPHGESESEGDARSLKAGGQVRIWRAEAWCASEKERRGPSALQRPRAVMTCVIRVG